MGYTGMRGFKGCGFSAILVIYNRISILAILIIIKLGMFLDECCAAWHYEHKWCNRELTLKCKLKYYVKPMKNPLGVSPSKGNQGITRGKEKIILT